MSETDHNPPTCDDEMTAEQSVCASMDPPDDAGHNNNKNDNTDPKGIVHEKQEAELSLFKRKLDELVAQGSEKRAKQSTLENCEEAGSSYAADQNEHNTSDDTANIEQSEISMNGSNAEDGAAAAASPVHTNATTTLIVSVKTEPVDTQEPSSSSAVNIKTEPVDTQEPSSSSAANFKTEPVDTQEPSSSLAAKIKTEPADTEYKGPTFTIVNIADIVARGSNNQQDDKKPIIRPSCKFGITCYRRNPTHRVDEAHPGDQDYRRPDYPPPPDTAPPCPFGNNCYRRNPTHFQSYKHPIDTNFDWNYKIYRMRLRNRQQNVNYFNLAPLDSDSSDEEEDPFEDNDLDLDEDYDPDLDDDEGIEVN